MASGQGCAKYRTWGGLCMEILSSKSLVRLQGVRIKPLLFHVSWHHRRCLKATSLGNKDFLTTRSRTTSLSQLLVQPSHTCPSQQGNFLTTLATLAPPGGKHWTPNAQKGRRSHHCSIYISEPTRALDQGKSSIAMTPLSPPHLTVPLAQLAPSHLSEKKNNWMLVRNDQIKI